MVKVGVISDTHGRLDPAAYAALADCGHIIHAGDICDPRIIRELQTLAPVTAVLGNNDFDEYGPQVTRIARPTIEGITFLVAHFPSDIALHPGDRIPDICIHGHTHIPRLDFGKNARPAQFILNPGSTTRPRGHFPASIAKIGIEQGQVAGIRIESLTGQTLMGVGTVS